jgi:23S rRNA (adenine2503-C2)-methyltransferase
MDLQWNGTMADNPLKTDIKELSREGLADWLKAHGIAPYRAGQIGRWIYQRNADDFSEMTDLGKPLRALLSDHFTLDRLTLSNVKDAADGTRKYLFELPDGARIETVRIPEKDHATLCISSQAGCAQGCRFCRTAAGGFQRNLTAGEIIAQIRDVTADMATAADTLPAFNLVFMGMGEPLANFDAVVQALRNILDADFGLSVSRRRVTLSTAGLVPEIDALGKAVPVKLAISLNAADDETRSRLMPINRRYPIAELLDACRRYPMPKRERITFEYILIRGINDSPQDAEKLAKLLRTVRAKINLIPFNRHDRSDFEAPDAASVQRFREILIQKDYTTIIRHSKGQDIGAACGQLAGAGPCPAAGGPAEPLETGAETGS